MKRNVFLIIILSLVLVCSSCAKKESPKGPYLAKVGNVTITQSDFDREMQNLPEFAQKLFDGKAGKERFLDELIKKELLYQEAIKKGLDKNTKFQKKIEDFKKISLIGLLLEKEIELKAKVTDQEVKNYYEENKDDFANISQIRASHILVKTEEEGKKILERLNKGENFAKIAEKTSIDPGTAKIGGDLGYFSQGQMVPEFEAAASRLKVSEISEPVKTKFGYHIIKVTDKKMGKPLEFEKVKNVIFQRLTAEKQKETFDSYIESLKKSYKIEINQNAVFKLFEEPEKKEEIQEKSEQTGKLKEQGSKGRKD